MVSYLGEVVRLAFAIALLQFKSPFWSFVCLPSLRGPLSLTFFGVHGWVQALLG